MAAVGAESSLAGEAEPGPDGGGVAAPAAALLQGDVEPGQAIVAQQPQHKHVKLPLSRVKALIKADPDVTLASQESVFVITKATELFIETIAKDAFIYAQQGKRKTLQRKDLDQAIFAMDEFAFLEGALD